MELPKAEFEMYCESTFWVEKLICVIEELGYAIFSINNGCNKCKYI